MTIKGHVAKVLSNRDLVLNIGIRDGVKTGMEFHVVDEVVAKDPKSGRDLTPIRITKARVMTKEVVEDACVASTFRVPAVGSSVSETLSRLLDAPERMVIKQSVEEDPAWSRLVQVGDTVVQFQDD